MEALVSLGINIEIVPLTVNSSRDQIREKYPGHPGRYSRILVQYTVCLYFIFYKCWILLS